ncbi:hypothetical protein NUW54_g9277 [Trametes sanguinea]|uniref:Uncharacterized protein n=1 Tax=Trametes sanguinea TaxID=158606 RepID=A0ACC1P7R1_9APHY|nr:hypothetical protein NUW54_g9277 [Trametes sanguinea]
MASSTDIVQERLDISTSRPSPAPLIAFALLLPRARQLLPQKYKAHMLGCPIIVQGACEYMAYLVTHCSDCRNGSHALLSMLTHVSSGLVYKEDILCPCSSVVRSQTEDLPGSEFITAGREHEDGDYEAEDARSSSTGASTFFHVPIFLSAGASWHVQAGLGITACDLLSRATELNSALFWPPDRYAEIVLCQAGNEAV